MCSSFIFQLIVVVIAEPTYKYTVVELVSELRARIAGAVDSKAFATDILAAVVSVASHCQSSECSKS
jgi:hypothetical protein